MYGRSGSLGRVALRSFAAGAALAVLTPTTASAHGLPGEFFVVATSVILVLHTASIAGAILCLRRRRSWLVAGVAVLIAAVAAIVWWLGFLQLAKSAAAARADWEWLLWTWILTPFAVFVLSGAVALSRHYLKRAG